MGIYKKRHDIKVVRRTISKGKIRGKINGKFLPFSLTSVFAGMESIFSPVLLLKNERL